MKFNVKKYMIRYNTNDSIRACEMRKQNIQYELNFANQKKMNRLFKEWDAIDKYLEENYYIDPITESISL